MMTIDGVFPFFLERGLYDDRYLLDITLHYIKRRFGIPPRQLEGTRLL